jgi:hypothetical protein
LPQELQARRDGLRKARSSMHHHLDRLTEAYLASTIPLAEYQRRRADLETKMQALDNQDNQDKQLDTQTNRQTEIAQLSRSVALNAAFVNLNLEIAKSFWSSRLLIAVSRPL